MNINDNTKYTTAARVLNESFDYDLNTLVVQVVGWDGQNLQRTSSENMAISIIENGDITYVAKAAPGTALGTAKWQVMKVDESSGTVITWADGNSSFDNTATDPASLTYS